MKRYGKLCAMGLIPLLAGYFLSYAVQFLPVPLFQFNLIFLFLWGLLSYKIQPPDANVLKNQLILHFPALIALILLLYQVLLRGAYWLNVIGLSTQMFFLPVLSLGVSVVNPFVSGAAPWPGYVAGFILMVLAGLIGGILKSKRLSNKSRR